MFKTTKINILKICVCLLAVETNMPSIYILQQIILLTLDLPSCSYEIVFANFFNVNPHCLLLH